jgi:hypothetical protein
MKDRIRGYHPHLGGLWIIFFTIVVLFAVRELLSLFGLGLFVRPAIGIVIGSITTFFLLVSLILRRWAHVQSVWFRPIPADEKARTEVATALANLPPKCFAFHSLVFKDFNIDHLVLTPQGCILIYTRGISGWLYSNGKRLQIDGKEADVLIGEVWHKAHLFQEVIQREFGKDIDMFPVLCLPRMSIEAPITVKGAAVIDLKLLPEVISAYQEETLDKSFLFILSGFLSRQRGGI